METLKIIRLLSALDLILTTVTVIFVFSLESNLPLLLQDYLVQELKADTTTTEIIAFTVKAITLILYFASLFGLIFVKKWARKLFITTTIIMYQVSFLLGPIVAHAVSFTFDQLSVLVQGMLLAFLVFRNPYPERALNKSLNLTSAENAPSS